MKTWRVLATMGYLAVTGACGSHPTQPTGGPCSTDQDCEEGWFCDVLDTGLCKKILCESDDQCRPTQFCDTKTTHRCVDRSCSSNDDCPYLYLCNEETGECYDPNPSNTGCSTPQPGCPCSSDEFGQTVGCRPEGMDPNVIDSCREGAMECDGERWGACQALYNENCDQISVGTGSMQPNEDNSQNVGKDVDGALVLVPDERHVEFGYLWVANTGENTVSKIDVDTGMEVARYPSVLDGVPGLDRVQIPYPATHPYNDCANCPSRTAIDFNGDAYVANRAFGRQGSVTKFANDIGDCVDRNGDGEITTSYDANGDGHIDVTDPEEFPGYDDECVLWTVPVGSPNGVPRALAIDGGNAPDLSPNGNVWVGLYNEQRAVKLAGSDGSVLAQVDLGNVHPYGAAVDAGGRVWFTSITDGTMAAVDALTATVIKTVDVAAGTGCAGAYGIAVDVKGRIWLGGWSCNTAIRYDPQTDQFATIEFAGAGRGDTTRGIAPDLQGTVWVAHTAGWVTRFDAETMRELDAFQILHHEQGGVVDNTIGVGIDRNGACWAVSRNDAYPNGTATRIQPDGTQDAFPVGLMPYTYSDFTGFGMVTVVRPNGWYNMLVEGCLEPDPPTNWKTLTWTESEPPGTMVRMRLKVADTVAGLEDAEWWGPYDAPPVDLDAEGVPDSRYMLLQVLLSSADPQVSPSFSGFVLDFDPCGGGEPQPD